MKAFVCTSNYDEQISSYFMEIQGVGSDFHMGLRYGMNPHQKPALTYTSDQKLPFTGECCFILFHISIV